MEQTELLRVRDIAPKLGVSVSRANQMITQGLLPHVRFGSSIRVPRGAWERWLNEREQEAMDAVRLPEPRHAAIA